MLFASEKQNSQPTAQNLGEVVAFLLSVNVWTCAILLLPYSCVANEHYFHVAHWCYGRQQEVWAQIPYRGSAPGSWFRVQRQSTGSGGLCPSEAEAFCTFGHHILMLWEMSASFDNIISDVNKTKFLKPRPIPRLRPDWQLTRPGFRTTAVRTIHVLLIIKTVSFQCI